MKQLRLTVLTLVIALGACKKDWLDAKPDKSLVVPSTVADYQALLDDSDNMNKQWPVMSMLGDGDFVISDVTYNALGSLAEKAAYRWAPTEEFFGGQPSSDWTRAYGRILQDNVVLDGLPSVPLKPADQAAFNNVKGSALFFRSYDCYALSQEFCKAYTAGTAGTDLGLPLRTASNVNLVLSRSSVQATYDQVISDLLKAAPLLPATGLYPTRPCRAAAFGFLARVYLSQENYAKALVYADSCLQIQNALLDFNQLSLTATTPIARFNKEVIFHASLFSYQSTSPGTLIIDPGLYQSYANNDLRQAILFRTQAGVLTTKASWGGSAVSAAFAGIATDEIYLIRAEAYARAGNVTAALNDLNLLLKNRYKTGTFSGLSANTADAVLSMVLAERRKELCFRNLRWADLRRLNKDPRFQLTLTRTINGQTYTLAPNSPRYVLPLDPIETTSGGLIQNPR